MKIDFRKRDARQPGKLPPQLRIHGGSHPHFRAGRKMRKNITQIGKSSACAGRQAIQEQMHHRSGVAVLASRPKVAEAKVGDRAIDDRRRGRRQHVNKSKRQYPEEYAEVVTHREQPIFKARMHQPGGQHHGNRDYGVPNI